MSPSAESDIVADLRERQFGRSSPHLWTSDTPSMDRDGLANRTGRIARAALIPFVATAIGGASLAACRSVEDGAPSGRVSATAAATGNAAEEDCSDVLASVRAILGDAGDAWRPFLGLMYRSWRFEPPREPPPGLREQWVRALRDLESAMSALQVRIEALPAPPPPELAPLIDPLARSVAMTRVGAQRGADALANQMHGERASQQLNEGIALFTSAETAARSARCSA